MNDSRLNSSFRDPSGFVFTRDRVLYRQVNHAYAEHYHQLITSGLYERLVAAGFLIAHQEVDTPPAEPETAYRIIQPESIPFISYPYEWPFSALQAAAEATLRIQEIAMECGMSLKDASAYNIQFRHAKPVFIDTLSFEPYVPGRPWTAYQQFCKHFVAPLAMMALCDVRFGNSLQVHLDGIPLDLASKMLPKRTYLNAGILMHVHLHAKSQLKHADAASGSGDGEVKSTSPKLSEKGALGILDSLRNTIRNLRWKPIKTEWGAYYEATNYSDAAMNEKRRLVAEYLDRAHPASVWDLGANTGRFSRLASERGIPTVSFDIDPIAVETNFRNCREAKETNLLPLLLDLTNPSPAIGWENRERDSLIQRGPVDTVLALALIHHLAISNNVPLAMTARFFASVCDTLIIEFVPKSDSQVRRLLATREDIFPDYHEAHFRAAYGEFFEIAEATPIEGSERVLFLMKKRTGKP